MNNEVFKEEINNLSENLAKIDLIIKFKEERIKYLEEEIKSLGLSLDSYKQSLIIEKNDLYDDVTNLKKIKKNPYFGHMMVSSNDYEDDVDMFIGEEALSDKDGNEIVYDWRSDVASMYYANQESARIKKILYRLMLRREVKIDKGSLISAYESYKNEKGIAERPIIDEFLKEVLREKRKLNQFTDIIRTIQSKQNEIIRSPLEENMLVQGVAGSGKTAIIVHRLSYLLYNNNIMPSQFLFITPSKTFVDKLSDLNRKLKINEIEMITFEEYFKNIFLKIFNKEYIKGFTTPDKIIIDSNDQIEVIKELMNQEIKNDFLNSIDFINSLKGIKSEIKLNTIYDYKKIIDELIDYSDNNKEVDPNEAISQFLSNMHKNINDYIDCKNMYTYDNPSPAMYDTKINNCINLLVKKINERIDFCEKCPMPMEEAISKVKSLENKKNEIFEYISKEFSLKKENEILNFVSKINVYLKENQTKLNNLNESLSKKQELIANFKLKLLRQREFNQLNNEASQLQKSINNISKIVSKVKSIKEKEIKELNIILNELNELVDLVDYDYIYYEDNKKIIDNFIEIISYWKNNNYKLTNFDKEYIIKILYYLIDNVGCQTRKYDFDIINQLETIKNSDLKNILSAVNEETIRIKERMSPRYLIEILNKVLNNPEYDFKKITLIDNNRRKIILDLFVTLKYENSNKYSYIYIDEVQDYSINDLDLLLKLEPQAVYNFYGDKDQKINGEVNNDFWDYFINKYKFSYFELNENYRNTINIVKYCNQNLNTKMIDIGNEGTNVVEKEFVSNEEVLEQIKSLDNCVLIADEEHLKPFKDNDIECYTVQEAKGLEFSNVVVLENKNWNNNYKYVAFTRSLNSLIIYKNLDYNNSKKVDDNKIQNIDVIYENIENSNYNLNASDINKFSKFEIKNEAKEVEEEIIQEEPEELIIENIPESIVKDEEVVIDVGEPEEEIPIITNQNLYVLEKIINYKPVNVLEIENRIILIAKIKGFLFEMEFEDYMCGNYDFALIKRIKMILSRIHVPIFADEIEYEDNIDKIDLKLSPIEYEIISKLRNNDLDWLRYYDINNKKEDINLLKKIFNIKSSNEEKDIEFKYTKEPQITFIESNIMDELPKDDTSYENVKLFTNQVLKHEPLTTIPEETDEQKEKIDLNGDIYGAINRNRKTNKNVDEIKDLFDGLI